MTLNDWAYSSIAMFFASDRIVDGMGKKEPMNFILKNPSTRGLFARTKQLNPDLVKDILDKAYGKDGSKVFDELR